MTTETIETTKTTETLSPLATEWTRSRDHAAQTADALRVNRASLLYETRLNRELERRRRKQGHTYAAWKLYHHRVTRLRPEARAAHLAWGYLRGVPYAAMEGPTTRTVLDRKAISRKVPLAFRDGLKSWLPEA